MNGDNTYNNISCSNNLNPYIQQLVPTAQTRSLDGLNCSKLDINPTNNLFLQSPTTYFGDSSSNTNYPLFEHSQSSIRKSQANSYPFFSQLEHIKDNMKVNPYFVESNPAGPFDQILQQRLGLPQMHNIPEVSTLNQIAYQTDLQNDKQNLDAVQGWHRKIGKYFSVFIVVCEPSTNCKLVNFYIRFSSIYRLYSHEKAVIMQIFAIDLHLENSYFSL